MRNQAFKTDKLKFNQYMKTLAAQNSGSEILKKYV